MGRLGRAIAACLDYTWPVLTTAASVIGSERLNRWLRPEEEANYEWDGVG